MSTSDHDQRMAGNPGGGGGGWHSMITGTASRIFKEFNTLFRSEIFKYTPYLGVWLSSMDFFPGESMVMQISFVMLIFYFHTNFFFFFGGGGGGKLLEGKPAVSRTMYQNTEMSYFQRKLWQILVLYVIMSYYNYKYVENIKSRINFLDKRQIS